MQTHVVVAVVYGAEVRFVFEEACTTKAEKRKRSVALKASLAKFGNARAGVEWGGGEGDAGHSVHVSYHGNVHLPSVPSTIQEARQAIQSIPQVELYASRCGRHASLPY